METKVQVLWLKDGDSDFFFHQAANVWKRAIIILANPGERRGGSDC